MIDIDKEKLIKFLRKEIKHDEDKFENSQTDYESKKYAAFLAQSNFLMGHIKSGKFDLEKPKETCKYEYPHCDEIQCMEYKTSCENTIDEELVLKSNPYKYCPYCSKTIEVVDE